MVKNEKQKYKVLNITNLSSEQLEKQMNELFNQGYKHISQSNLEWYQGKGFSGVILFEFIEEQTESNMEWVKEGVNYWENPDCPREYLEYALRELENCSSKLKAYSKLPSNYFNAFSDAEIKRLIAEHEYIQNANVMPIGKSKFEGCDKKEKVLKEALEEIDNILKEAIDSLDKGEKVNGLEYARELITKIL